MNQTPWHSMQLTTTAPITCSDCNEVLADAGTDHTLNVLKTVLVVHRTICTPQQQGEVA